MRRRPTKLEYMARWLQEGPPQGRTLVKNPKKFKALVDGMVKDGWILLFRDEESPPRYVANDSRIFELYDRYTEHGLLDLALQTELGFEVLEYGCLPQYTDDIASTLAVHLVLGAQSMAKDLLDRWDSRVQNLYNNSFVAHIAHRFGAHIPPEVWHARMPSSLKTPYVLELAKQYAIRLKALPEFWQVELDKIPGARAKAHRNYIASCHLSPADTADAAKIPLTKARALERFRSSFWSGQYRAAYAAGCQVIAKSVQSKEPQIRGVEGVDMMLCAMAVSADAPEAINQVVEWSAKGRLAKPVPMDLYSTIHEIARCLLEDKAMPVEGHASDFRELYPERFKNTPRFALVFGLGLIWTNAIAKMDQKDRTSIVVYLNSVITEDELYPAVRRELEAVVSVILGKDVEQPCLATSFQSRSSWERLLDRLQNAIEVQPISEASGGSSAFKQYISWEVDASSEDGSSWVQIQPRHVGSARARRGKPVSLETLREKHEDLFSETDFEVMTQLQVESSDDYYFHPSQATVSLDRTALLKLVGHPHVQNKKGEPLRIDNGVVEIDVKESSEGLHVSVVPSRIGSGPSVCWEWTSNQRLVVYHRPAPLSAALEILGDSDVVIPSEAGGRLTPILKSMSKHCRVITNGAVMEGQSSREGDPSIYVSLRWSGSVLWVDPEVLPFGTTDVRCFPGRGDVHVTEHVDGELCTATRDLDLERKNLGELLDKCPGLKERSHVDFEHGEPCRIDVLEDALSVTMELAQADAKLSWESEQRLMAPSAVDDSRFKIRVGKAREWFSTDLRFEVDGEKVIGFQELLEARIGDSRFLRVGKDQIVALSKAMRRRLDRLAAMGELSEDGVKSSLTSLPVIESLVEDIEDVELDDAAAEQLKRLRRALAYTPSVPKTLNATLRPYQEEGFVWMCRLAKAQLGACLADDMGLGKTVQTLALLARRQSQGPALVVAPASVVQNWIDEARRFTPKLRTVDLAELREELEPASLGPKDLVVASYGIMAKEVEKLEAVHFSTLVFDEAHALKNWGTRRTQAAARLCGDFRLGLTGTPVENHIGEIWSLFQILVPGLLGSKKQFEAKYSLPGPGAVPDIAALRVQLEPFLLRRTKSQVLSDLPELNESVLKVKPSPSELAFYRALQKTAIEACDAAEASATPDKRLKVLAEITRLRQAAVDPRLVDDVLGPEGEKIKLLVSKLVALQKRGHRALVFTQFLGSLALVKDALELAGIEYFELTGASTKSKRAKMIAAFQDGQRDVFLISLRAGGVGVNLTGADYVFHLDPWWNPAVEDQATARAHRMGQTKPVQVYRLVSSATIEEKILAMHELKRGLAQDLLGNLDRAKKLSLKQLRGLLG